MCKGPMVEGSIINTGLKQKVYVVGAEKGGDYEAKKGTQGPDHGKSDKSYQGIKSLSTETMAQEVK